MLYFMWVDYYRETGKWLFANEICAWQLGPVIPDVYYDFCQYAGLPIYLNHSSLIGHPDRDILGNIIGKYINISASALVDLSHRSGSAWSRVYNSGSGNRSVIPFNLIIDAECGR
jgi:uncharacterized phage-associated protein